MRHLMSLPPALPVSDIRKRLLLIFPDGTPRRTYVTREMSAKTVFVMLYIGAIETNSRWMRPDQVTRMTDTQAAMVSEMEREAWLCESMKSARGNIRGRWYAANTREPIRDETLRQLEEMGAVMQREGLPVTSPKPRYALTEGFAALFDPELTDDELEGTVADWRSTHLTASALARTAIVGSGVVASDTRVLVTLPNEEARLMAKGPSSVISKAVVEEFAPRFLDSPGLLWLSESGNKVVAQDDELAQKIGLIINPDRILPDIILVDIRPNDPLLIFVEVVASEGPITEARRTAFLQIATEGGFSESQVTFVTAYSDRDGPAFRKTASALAWAHSPGSCLNQTMSCCGTRRASRLKEQRCLD